MTEFKPGDRVRVEFDATVNGPAKHGPAALAGWISLSVDGIAPGALPAEFCTLIRPALEVGNVLTPNDPEPPVGTVVRAGNARLYGHFTPGAWAAAGDTGVYRWPVTPNPVTVLFVAPDAESRPAPE